METNAKYLGDGVYYQDDGHYVILTAEDGLGVTNRIYLEREVLDKLLTVIFAKNDDLPY